MKISSRTVVQMLMTIVALLVSSASANAAVPAGAPGVDILAQHGFGEHENSYAWSMGWFKNKLYVGTGRDVLCVENETVQFYYPLEEQYSTNPSPEVRCPPNPYNLNLRAEIWQYTPHDSRWKLVYRAPTERNPKAPSKRVGTDIAYRGMITFKDPQGRQALFAGGVTADEYLPSLLETHPPRILRSYDGVHWQALKLPPIIVDDPNGNTAPMGFRSLLVWKHHLFVTATPDLTGDGSLFEITNPWSEHPGLVQVSPPKVDIFEVAAFHGDLYLGAGNKTTGYSVWRTHSLKQPFTPVVSGGAGRGSIVTSVVSMHVYRDSLYVGASGWYNRNTLPISELIRISPTGRWTLVVGNSRTLPDGKTIYPTSGLGDGFGSLFNTHFWRMAAQGGGLYVGTNSWSYLWKAAKADAWLGDVFAAVEGYQLWATCDGEDWFPVTRDAFGKGEFDFGARTLQPGGPHGEDLYIGSANHALGTTIMVDRAPACSSLINSGRSVAAPSAMIADKVGKGTLLSWKPSPSAVRYEVLAAREISTSLYLKAPPTLPNGFQMEGAMPTVTEPEAPGSTPVTLSLPGAFEPVATTTTPFYVDRSNANRVYEVVAENAAGQASGPSNIQIVPTPEPAATFGSLWNALGSHAPGSGRAVSARTGPGSRPLQLLDAAQAAWNRGDRSTALADVRRLQASAHDNDEELAKLAARLERRIQYANVVGGL